MKNDNIKLSKLLFKIYSELLLKLIILPLFSRGHSLINEYSIYSKKKERY